MARRSHGRRRRRRTSWKAAFWTLLIGIIIGTVLGVWLCRNFEVFGVIDPAENSLGFVEKQKIIAPNPTVELTAEPVEATPVSAEPTDAPVEPTPVPAEPTPVPVDPTAEPVELTENDQTETEEIDLAALFAVGSDEAEAADEQVSAPEETPEPVVPDESGDTTAEGDMPEETADQEMAEETDADDVTQVAPRMAALTEPYTRTEPFTTGEWFSFETEIDENGEPYYLSDGNGTAAALSVKVADFMDPDEYAAQYAETYQLFGSEAAIVLEIRNDSDVTIMPQEAVRIAFANKADVLYDGYPLMDAPMGGSTEISIAPGETMTLYKRFAYDETDGLFPYMTVTYMVGGETYRSYYLINGMQ